MKIEELKIHFFYLVSILVMALIVVSTGLWTDKKDFTTYLTNAATMISIVLGLVAIFYSFISNTSLNQSLGNILLISSGVDKSNQLVNQYVAQAEQLNKANLQNSEQLSTISLNIKDNLNSLNTLLHELNDKSTQLESTVATIPDRFEKLETVVYETTKDLKGVDLSIKKSKINWSTEDIEQYIDRSTLSTNIAIYACLEYARKRKKFNFKALAEAIDTSTPAYIRGYIAASYAVGLFKRVIDGTYYTITDVQPALKDFDVMESVNNYLSSTTALTEEQKNDFYEVIRKVNELLEK